MSARSEIIEAGGERLHLALTGPQDGPPVLLTSGLGGAWFDWNPVTDLLRDRFRLIAFDRPGLGLSPSARTAPSLRREVRVLAGLAEWVGSPVIVVAHSLGGFHAEAFARVHPEMVTGLVQVDPSYEADPWSDVRLSAAVEPVTRLAGRLAGLSGIPRLVAPYGRRSALRLFAHRTPAVTAAEVRAVYGRGTVIGAMMAENAAYREMAADLIALRTRRPFPPIPLVVLTATGDLGTVGKAKDWADGHRRLAAMSPYGRQVELPDSLHMVHFDRPDLVADAVREVAP